VTPAVPGDGRYWRVLSPRWAHAPLSGGGAARHGGRWNRPGNPALYLSQEIETAFAEYQQELGVRPGTFAAFEVAGATVVDLNDSGALAALDIDPSDLSCPWKQIALVERRDPPTWLICDRLRSEVDGLRVPSVQYAGGSNLVLWRWNVAGAPTVTVHDPQGELTERNGR
jgi:RES domain-containing protein